MAPKGPALNWILGIDFEIILVYPRPSFPIVFLSFWISIFSIFLKITIEINRFLLICVICFNMQTLHYPFFVQTILTYKPRFYRRPVPFYSTLTQGFSSVLLSLDCKITTETLSNKNSEWHFIFYLQFNWLFRVRLWYKIKSSNLSDKSASFFYFQISGPTTFRLFYRLFALSAHLNIGVWKSSLFSSNNPI